ncbi:cupin domain-containing protein [Dactylosporangium sp. NPDC000555]|uniref:cupin domain-containing protein n=1 Tax=Dactylosporangium sp. NPDC000555 TaxID=3154260 RepID=UPI0033303A4D
MDVLSDAVAVMRTGRPVSARLAWRVPWGQRFATVPGAAGVQVILRGSCWLVPDDRAPIALSAGDVLLMAHGRGYALADSPATPLQPCTAGSPEPARPVPGAEAGVVLCGAYELEPNRAHPLLDELPELVHLRAPTDQSPQLRAVVELLGAELERPGAGAGVGVTALLDLLFLHALRGWFDRVASLGGDRTAGTNEDGARGWAGALRDSAELGAVRPRLPVKTTA